MPGVKVLGKDVLQDFMKRQADVRGPVAAWLADVEEAQWTTPQDVRMRYPTVSFIGRHAVFNLKGTKYRLDITVAFNTGIVLVNRMGTHAEYADWKF